MRQKKRSSETVNCPPKSAKDGELFISCLRASLFLQNTEPICCMLHHQALDKMESEWKPVMLEVLPYKETGTFIMKVSDDCSQLLDDHIVMAQSMSFSPYKKPFEERITTWESKLVMTQDVMDEWLQCQRQWLYLEPIFSSEDINRQLPVESKRYQTMERIWRKVMNSAKGNPQVSVEPTKKRCICKLLLDGALCFYPTVMITHLVINPAQLTIRPVALSGYGSIAHEAKPNGLLICGL